MKKFTSEEIKEFVSRPLFDEKVILNKDPSWPKISIVTPSYNQGKFLERTILSVLNQNYPNLEYIIIDGGSTDGSVEIIKKYEKYLTYWVSEKDKGQTNAINKGFQISSGEILAWLNSDDTYLRHTIFRVVNYFQKYPQIDLIYGNAYLINKDDQLIGNLKTIDYDFDIHLFGSSIIPQPTAFWRRKAFYEINKLDERVKMAMDGDLWFRLFLHGCSFCFIDAFLANVRIHEGTISNRFKKEHFKEAQRVRENIYRNVYGQPPSKCMWFMKRLIFNFRKKLRRKQLDFIGGKFYITKFK